jgi:hypothetical protein
MARGSHLLELSGSYYLALTPLVREDHRSEWETYSVENQGWLQENIDGSTNTEIQQPPIMPFIWKSSATGPVREDDPADPYYGPFWQLAPPIAFAVNQNIFALPGFSQVFEAVTKADSTVLSFVSRLEEEVSDEIREWPYSYISSPVHRLWKRAQR